MLELYEEHSIALPYGGLITKILKATLPNILANEHVDILEGPFGKGTVMKLNAQLQRIQAQAILLLQSFLIYKLHLFRVLSF